MAGLFFHRRTLGKALVVPPPPATLIHWLDASRAGSLSSNARGLARWADVSGNGLDLVAPAGNEPILSLDADSKTSVQIMSGQSLELAAGTYQANQLGYEEWTYAMVVRFLGDQPPYAGFWNGLNTQAGNPNNLSVDPFRVAPGLNNEYIRAGYIQNYWQLLVISSSNTSGKTLAYFTGNGDVQLIQDSQLGDNALRGCVFGGGCAFKLRTWQLHSVAMSPAEMLALRDRLAAQTGLAL